MAGSRHINGPYYKLRPRPSDFQPFPQRRFSQETNWGLRFDSIASLLSLGDAPLRRLPRPVVSVLIVAAIGPGLGGCGQQQPQPHLSRTEQLASHVGPSDVALTTQETLCPLYGPELVYPGLEKVPGVEKGSAVIVCYYSTVYFRVNDAEIFELERALEVMEEAGFTVTDVHLGSALESHERE